MMPNIEFIFFVRGGGEIHSGVRQAVRLSVISFAQLKILKLLHMSLIKELVFKENMKTEK